MVFHNDFFSQLIPLHYSIIENDISTFKSLFNSKEINPFIKDKHNLTIWHYATKYGRFEILKEICSKTHEFINNCDINNKTTLINAIEYECTDIFNFLISMEDIDVNIKDQKGISILKF